MTLDPVLLFGSISTVLASVVATGIKKVWVWGWVLAECEQRLDEMETDRNFWRDVALKSMGHTDKALDVARKAP